MYFLNDFHTTIINHTHHLFIIIVLLIVIILYIHYNSRNYTNNAHNYYTLNNEQFDNSNAENQNAYSLQLFYTTWCGYSVQFLPVWEKVKLLAQKYPNVQFISNDCTTDKQACTKANITGFPTMLFYVNGVPQTYTGERTVDAIDTFIQQNISQ